MDKFLTKENIIIAVVVFWAIIQSNYFATKLDVANMKLEMSNMRLELQKYSDDGDKELLNEINKNYKELIVKLDKLK